MQTYSLMQSIIIDIGNWGWGDPYISFLKKSFVGSKNSKNVCMIGGIGHNNDRLGVRGHHIIV